MIGRMLLFFIGDEDHGLYLSSACADLFNLLSLMLCRGREIHKKSILTIKKKATDFFLLFEIACISLRLVYLFENYVEYEYRCYALVMFIEAFWIISLF